MANLPLAFIELLAGAIIADAGIKGSSIGDVVKGQASFSAIQGLTTSPSGASSGQSVGSGLTAAGSGAAAGTTGAPGSHGLVTMSALTTIGRQHHWTAAQIADWMRVVVSESNGTLTDTNPSSGAYGIAQGITGPSWYPAHGGDAGTVTGQLTAMANYMDTRYGNPSAAWAFHVANGWY